MRSEMEMICPLRGGHITVEAVGPGHPDKVCDQISDAVLDAALADDPHSRVAIETTGKGRIKLIGEMTTSSVLDLRELTLRVHREIGYRDDEVDGVDIDVVQQSGDIAMGTNDEVQGAGDQGIMVGYAVNTPEYEYMPIAYALAQKLVARLDEARQAGTLPFLRPDNKSQVVMRDGQVVRVTIATQHTADVELGELRGAVYREVIVPVVGDVDFANCQINGTGRFVNGSFAADAGLTGRKIVVDQYGPWVPVGGGAFSGKDPSKVDRTAAYMARLIAKTIVADGMAEEALVHLAYTIGYTEPDSVGVRVFKPRDPDLDFETWIRENFPLSPGAMIKRLGLTTPSGWSYQQTAMYGHFGHTEFPWEQVNKIG
ncbi:MAG: S-adenosylmethionine synthase [Candidatus Uhrbacteria bacterium GW2011_GWA2_52_8d]|uniref:Methionine adenosyltransferase n=1 Tax=Candidatus Uhrbacteria bacterium GW2011_GWA2_52_8d TaxID=1618979 RepID=A0A0G1ZUJ4_9BACT|nr:MAG: S-adenosylmethionine synthase [Candidatus Uhrbacteria bacterium GW2011_GWA2_52_8d]